MIGLDFERPIVELERKIQELESFTSGKKIDLSSEVKKLEEKLDKLRRDIYANLTPWQRVQIARHPQRPYTLDCISSIFSDFLEILNPAALKFPSSLTIIRVVEISRQGNITQIMRNFLFASAINHLFLDDNFSHIQSSIKLFSEKHSSLKYLFNLQIGTN